ncbi:hypothetical protein B0H10DRAFT_943540 [Mycena sp. CBHHK59/15]|nr:hypothetical protein B0H10DRAFT_943540 [Mycena sp. CBHHK59/15]
MRWVNATTKAPPKKRYKPVDRKVKPTFISRKKVLNLWSPYEHHNAANDYCDTCIRLNIDCLGWGPKRPQWMKDKQVVKAHRLQIKETLAASGLLRNRHSICGADTDTVGSP